MCSDQTFFTSDNVTYSNVNGTLLLQNISSSVGQDAVGQYKKVSMMWASTSGVPYVTGIRVVSLVV